MKMELDQAIKHVLKEKYDNDSISLLHGTLSINEPMFDEESNLLFISPGGVLKSTVGEEKSISYTLGVLGELLNYCDSILLELELTNLVDGKVSNTVEYIPKEVIQQTAVGPNFTIAGRGPSFTVEESVMIRLILHTEFKDEDLINRVNELTLSDNLSNESISFSLLAAEMILLEEEEVSK